MQAWYDVLEDEDNHIATSENGWTDNELGYDWLVNCFEPASAKYQRGEYRLLIIDGHQSHVSTKFIKFCVENKIILLCLPAHTTHLLQPLDVGVFSPLAFHYKKELELLTRFSTVTVDKIDFLKIVQKARKSAISDKNIQTAWRVTGLVPYDPSIVLQKLANKQPVAQNADNSASQSTTIPSPRSTSGDVNIPKITASFYLVLICESLSQM